MRGTPSTTTGPSKPATLAPVSPGYAKVPSGLSPLGEIERGPGWGAAFPSGLSPLPLEAFAQPPAGKHGWGREVLPLLPTGED